MKMQVTYQAPTFWNGAYGSKPSPTPVYGKALDRMGNPLELDVEVLAFRDGLGSKIEPIRARVVAIGDEGLPGAHIVRVRQHGSAYLNAYSSAGCQPHEFDEYKWYLAETKAASDMDARGIDLTRCIFGDFYFDLYQRQVMKRYLETATTQK